MSARTNFRTHNTALSVTTILAATVAITVGSGAIAQTLFGTDSGSNSLLSIDTSSASVTVVGPFGTDVNFEGLAYDSNSRTLYMVGGRGNNSLYQVDPLSGAATLVGDHGLSDMFGLGYDTTNNVLYGTRRVNGTGLYAINTTNGTATEVTPPLSVFAIDGLDYDPVRDRLLGIVVGAGTVYEIDRTTGVLTEVAATSGFVNNAGAAYDPNTNTLWVADYSGNIFTFDLDTGDRSTVGSELGYNFSGLAFGFGLDVIMIVGPTAAEELANLTAAAGTNSRIIVLNAHELARMRGQDSLATRDALTSFTRGADPETGEMSVSQSTMAHDGMMGNIYIWIDITGFHADDDDANRSYTGRGLQIGADVALSPDMVAGLSFGVQDLDSSVGAFNQDGTLRFIQPYLAYRSGAWSGEASLIYGYGDYDQTSAGGDGTGSTRLAALTFTGSYDMAMDGFALTPTFGFAHGREKIEGETGALANAGSETVRFTQASLGAEIRTDVSGGEVFAGLHADWLNTSSDTALVSDLLVDDGWTGRIEFGVSTAMGNGVELETSLALSGLGGDLRQTSGALRFAFRF